MFLAVLVVIREEEEAAMLEWESRNMLIQAAQAVPSAVKVTPLLGYGTSSYGHYNMPITSLPSANPGLTVSV